jgi:LmbE family N-acetylglucosaminyl deacetylase
MLQFDAIRGRGEPLRLLCLGAHSDDIEIGCGGSILKLLRTRRNIEVCWVVFSSGPKRGIEARRSAERFLARASQRTIVVKTFRTSYFPQVATAIKDYFETLTTRFSPDVVFTHYRDDRHQDHRVISDLTWNTFRNTFILEYEIPKYDGDLGSPNVFVPLERALCQQKVRLLLEGFKTQSSKDWFDSETFLAILRLRGVEAHTPYAEAFHCRKLVLG